MRGREINGKKGRRGLVRDYLGVVYRSIRAYLGALGAI